MIQELQQEKFDTAFESENLIVLDFWAPWCGPCKALAPILEDVSTTFNNKVDFYKVNIDDNSDVAYLYSIRSVPTLVFIKNKQTIKTNIGFIDKAKLTDIITELL